MKLAKITALSAMLCLCAGVAQAAMLFGPAVAPLSDRDGGPLAEPVADLVLSSGSNTGNCTTYPPDWDLIVFNGIYFYEFCDYPAIPNWVWIDVHKKPDLAGNVGRLVGSTPAPCSTWPPGYSMPPAEAKQRFCND